MEDKDHTEKMLQSLTQTGLGSLSPNMGIIQEVLNLDGRDITNLSAGKLSEYIYVISQYSTYIQLLHNVAKGKARNARRVFNVRLRKAYVDAKIDKRLTSLEKEAIAMSHDPELTELEQIATDEEVQAFLYDRIPEQLLEIGNSLKKELSLRSK